MHGSTWCVRACVQPRALIHGVPAWCPPFIRADSQGAGHAPMHTGAMPRKHDNAVNARWLLGLTDHRAWVVYALARPVRRGEARAASLEVRLDGARRPEPAQGPTTAPSDEQARQVLALVSGASPRRPHPCRPACGGSVGAAKHATPWLAPAAAAAFVARMRCGAEGASLASGLC